MTFQLDPSFFGPDTLEKREKEVFRQAPAARKLKRLLLEIGGEMVCWHMAEPHLDALILDGRRFPARSAVFWEGFPSACHENTATLFLKGLAEPVTGYALCNDRWVQHSWGWDGKRVVETTTRRKAYFGLHLSGQDALKFAFGNAGHRFEAIVKRSSKRNRERLKGLLDSAVSTVTP